MKKLLIVAITLLACSCTTKDITTQPVNYPVNTGNIQVLIIDSCEYIRCNNGNATWGSHKGNCTYCKQRNSK